jgi:predicted aspartyl protease
MSRQARLVVPGCPHHVTERGNHRQDVFFVEAELGMVSPELRPATFGLIILACAMITCLAGCQRGPRQVLGVFQIPDVVQGDSLVVPVIYRGKEYSFLLDTGGDAVVFDKSLKDTLGPPLLEAPVRYADSEGKVTVHWGQDAYWGSINLKEGGPVFCDDLESLRADSGCDIRGVIGMSVLRGYCIQFDESTVTVATSDSINHPEWGKAAPIRNHHTISLFPVFRVSPPLPHILARLNDKRDVSFLVDTGDASFCALNEQVIRDLSVAPATQPVGAITIDAGGRTQNSRDVKCSLELAGYHWQDDGFTSTSGSSRVGLSYLLFFRPATLDFPNQKIYLSEPRTQVLSKMTRDVTLQRKDNKLVVVGAWGAAEKDGLRRGDVILKIDDKDAADMESWRAARYFMYNRSNPDGATPVSVSVERNGKTVDMVVRVH